VMLRGTWLRKFGFGVGVHIGIEVVHGQITVRPLWNDGQFEGQGTAADKPITWRAQVKDR
ncbi:type I addiction module toxin, SymE family, partial [Pseudomonas viridiflava]|uniref:type I addiction module toxin, SymE family n=1 Tax=Pseudomonas viridiflava TaxID=33069 RepID=UPI000F0397A9